MSGPGVRSARRRPWTAPALLAAALVVAACASPEPAARVHPYRVLLLPVEGAEAALTSAPTEDSVPFSITPASLDAEIRDAIVSADVFSDVVVEDGGEPQVPGREGATEDAAAAASRVQADLILRIHVKSARMVDLGHNGATVWSTLTWTLLPLPTWFVDDRSYATELSAHVDLYDPGDLVKPTVSFVASSGRQDLDLWDRGPSVYVAVVPPPFLRGDLETVSRALTVRAVAQLRADIVERIREQDIPSRFELNVSWDGRAVDVAAASRRRLRSIEVVADGVRVADWVETRLVPDAESTGDRFVYRRRVEALPAGPDGGAVRVIAEDEIGSREVRTVTPPRTR